VSSVNAVRSVEIGVSNVERSTQFYRDVWGLIPIAEHHGKRYFRASGPEHHVLVLSEAAQPGIINVEFSAASIEDVRALHALSARRAAELSEPEKRATPGGGFGFTIRDANDRTWTISTDLTAHADPTSSPDRPYKLSHVVLNSADVAGESAAAITDFGFHLRDESRSMMFLGCNADHHSLAFARGSNGTLNHVAFEVPSIDAVMRGAGRLKRDGFPMQWGVGRHGPGSNVYSYFLDPDDLAIEYTSELLQVDDASYRPGTPKDWERPPFYDAWGLAEPPTQRFLDASSGALAVHAIARAM
jgi:catechol 2,3-dioxygenase-like lactoylglutathione lyase family enzyme